VRMSLRSLWLRAVATLALIVAIFQPSAVNAACTGNAIVCENQNAGTPETTWDISGSGDPSIQGFATASAYTIDIYRMGYYQGNGARKITSISPSANLPQSQPACLTDSSTGLIDC